MSSPGDEQCIHESAGVPGGSSSQRSKERVSTFYPEFLMPAWESDWLLLEMGIQTWLGSSL